MSRDIAINYLSYARAHYHVLTMKTLGRIDRGLGSRTVLYIYSHRPESYWGDFRKKLKDQANIESEVVVGPQKGLDYMDKIHKATKNPQKYSVSMDEDCFISADAWNYWLSNIEELNDPKAVFLAPLLSNGIPTADIWKDNFMDPQARDR